MPYSSVEQLSQKDVKSARLLQRVHGAIVHGFGRFFFLVDPDRIPKGANQGLEFTNAREIITSPHHPNVCVYGSCNHSP